MADQTILQETLDNAIVDADFLLYWKAGTAVQRRVARSSLIGATLTGAGTIVTGGYTLTVPATGTAALKTGTPTAGRVASWAGANTVQDGGFALSDIGRLGQANTWTATQTFDTINVTNAINGQPGGLRSTSVADVSSGQTLSVDITTSSANNAWKHMTTVLVTLGNTSVAVSTRAIYAVDVAWDINTIGTSATVLATNVRINNTSNVTITGATAITNGFRLQFAVGAGGVSSARNSVTVIDTRIGNIAIATSVA